MLYSTYAIYASGKDAVLGGTLVLALDLHHLRLPRAALHGRERAGRYASRGARRAGGRRASCLDFHWDVVAFLGVCAKGKGPGFLATTRTPSRFHTDEGGKPAGYAVELCQKVAEASSQQPTWVAVNSGNAAAMLRDGKVNLICGEFDRLSARKDMSFSIPIFQSGIGALLRSDAPLQLKTALSERPGPSGQPGAARRPSSCCSRPPSPSSPARRPRRCCTSG